MSRKSDNRICKLCKKPYEYGFWGTGIKYCSKQCSREALSIYKNNWYNQNIKNTKAKCLLCKRNILSVGERNYVGKYCSKRCGTTANRINRTGAKTVNIKMPVKTIVVKQIFKVSVEDIPLIWGNKNV